MPEARRHGVLFHCGQVNQVDNRARCIDYEMVHEMVHTFQAGWWFGTWLLFSPIVGMMIQSDELIFFRG
jgi:hypothetical protein